MNEIEREISPTCIQNPYRNKIIVNNKIHKRYIHICIHFSSLNLCGQAELYTHKSQIAQMSLFIYVNKFTFFCVCVCIYTQSGKSLLCYLWTQLWAEGLTWLHRIYKNRNSLLKNSVSTMGSHFDQLEQVKGKAQ